MNRAVILAGALTVILGVGVVLFMRGGESTPPAAATNTSAPPPAPRVVPKKLDPAPVAEAPRKAAPKKSEPKPAEPAPAPAAAPTMASLSLESDVRPFLARNTMWRTFDRVFRDFQ